jgi:DNA-binding response OmpR family regulator
LRNALPKQKSTGTDLQHAQTWEPIPQVLIVEDDLHYAFLLRKALQEIDPAYKSAQFDVRVTPDPVEALQFAERDAIDIFVVDLKFRDKNDPENDDAKIGKQLVKSIQEKTNAGLIVHTSEPADESRPELIELGADDYIEKMSRDGDYRVDLGIHQIIKGKLIALWRRVQLLRPSTSILYRHFDRLFLVGSYRFTIGSRLLIGDDGREVKLSATEHALLRHFCTIDGHAVDREQFNFAILRRDKDTEDRRLDNVIYRLRAKLGSTLNIVSDRAGTYKLLDVQEISAQKRHHIKAVMV